MSQRSPNEKTPNVSELTEQELNTVAAGAIIPADGDAPEDPKEKAKKLLADPKPIPYPPRDNSDIDAIGNKYKNGWPSN